MISNEEKELFDLLRKNYSRHNEDYLKEQVKNALATPLLTKKETLDGLLDWVVIGGCTGLNDHYRKFVLSAIGHLMNNGGETK